MTPPLSASVREIRRAARICQFSEVASRPSFWIVHIFAGGLVGLTFVAFFFSGFPQQLKDPSVFLSGLVLGYGATALKKVYQNALDYREKVPDVLRRRVQLLLGASDKARRCEQEINKYATPLKGDQGQTLNQVLENIRKIISES